MGSGSCESGRRCATVVQKFRPEIDGGNLPCSMLQHAAELSDQGCFSDAVWPECGNPCIFPIPKPVPEFMSVVSAGLGHRPERHGSERMVEQCATNGSESQRSLPILASGEQANQVGRKTFSNAGGNAADGNVSFQLQYTRRFCSIACLDVAATEVCIQHLIEHTIDLVWNMHRAPGPAGERSAQH